ncbi:MAG: alpha/beta fold hydrolase [Actinomycetota bacterium]
MEMEPVTFTTQDGVRLEGELRRPDAPPAGTAIICHPHPRHGGSKDHPLLWAMRNDLAGIRGFAVLAFNFRGVLGSAGTYGAGHDELRDVQAAITHVRGIAPDVPTVVAGWSFGANVALRETLDDERVSGLAVIGLPIEPQDLSLPALPEASVLRVRGLPTLMVAGENDEYCPRERLEAYSAAAGATAAVVQGTDHYFWRRERDAAALIGSFAAGIVA